MKKALNIRVVTLAIGIVVAIVIAFSIWILPFQEGVSGSNANRPLNIRLFSKNVILPSIAKVVHQVVLEFNRQN